LKQYFIKSALLDQKACCVWRVV